LETLEILLLPQSQVVPLFSTLLSLLKTLVDTLWVDLTKKVAQLEVALSEEAKPTTSSAPIAAQTKQQSTNQT